MTNNSEQRSILTNKRVKTSTRVPWNDLAKNIGAVISQSSYCKRELTDVSVVNEAEEKLEVSELFNRMFEVSKEETKRAVKYLRHIVLKLENMEVLKSTYNQMLLSARFDLQSTSKHTEKIHFRACNALHLEASELEIGKRVSFEATLVDNGIVLTGLSGFYIRLAVMKGSFKSEISQIELKSFDGQLLMKIITRNPLIDQTESGGTPVELVANLELNNASLDSDRAREIADRQQGSKHLRETCNRMKAFNDTSVGTLAKKMPIIYFIADHLDVFKKDKSSRTRKLIKYLFSFYAIALIIAAYCIYLSTKVDLLVPIVLLISAVSYLLLSSEKSISKKSKSTVTFNSLALLIVVVKLQLFV